MEIFGWDGILYWVIYPLTLISWIPTLIASVHLWDLMVIGTGIRWKGGCSYIHFSELISWKIHLTTYLSQIFHFTSGNIWKSLLILPNNFFKFQIWVLNYIFKNCFDSRPDWHVVADNEKCWSFSKWKTTCHPTYTQSV